MRILKNFKKKHNHIHRFEKGWQWGGWISFGHPGFSRFYCVTFMIWFTKLKGIPPIEGGQWITAPHKGFIIHKVIKYPIIILRRVRIWHGVRWDIPIKIHFY